MIRVDVELVSTERETPFQASYQRFLGDAVIGIGDLFGRHDIVDAQWRIVEPPLDDIAYKVPMHRDAGAR